MSFLIQLLRSLASLGMFCIIASNGVAAVAAEKVIFKYKIFRESLPVTELTKFATEGIISPTLQFYLNKSQQDPDALRRTLTQEADVNVVVLSRALNSQVGNLLVDQFALAIHPPTNVANRQATRAALVLSASKDNKISLLEVIQNYPTPEVEVEGERIVQAQRQISAIGGRLRGMAEDVLLRL